MEYFCGEMAVADRIRNFLMTLPDSVLVNNVFIRQPEQVCCTCGNFMGCSEDGCRCDCGKDCCDYVPDDDTLSLSALMDGQTEMSAFQLALMDYGLGCVLDDCVSDDCCDDCDGNDSGESAQGEKCKCESEQDANKNVNAKPCSTDDYSAYVSKNNPNVKLGTYGVTGSGCASAKNADSSDGVKQAHNNSSKTQAACDDGKNENTIDNEYVVKILNDCANSVAGFFKGAIDAFSDIINNSNENKDTETKPDDK
jgi:hypothetical protein